MVVDAAGADVVDVVVVEVEAVEPNGGFRGFVVDVDECTVGLVVIVGLRVDDVVSGTNVVGVAVDGVVVVVRGIATMIGGGTGAGRTRT